MVKQDGDPTGSKNRSKAENPAVDELRRDLFLKDPRTMDKGELESIRRALGAPGRGGSVTRVKTPAPLPGRGADVPKPAAVDDADQPNPNSTEALLAARRARTARLDEAEDRKTAAHTAHEPGDDGWYAQARTTASRLNDPAMIGDGPAAVPVSARPGARRSSRFVGAAVAAIIFGGGLAALGGGTEPGRAFLISLLEDRETETASVDVPVAEPVAVPSAEAEPAKDPVAEPTATGPEVAEILPDPPAETPVIASRPGDITDGEGMVHLPKPGQVNPARPLKPVLIATVAPSKQEWMDLIADTAEAPAPVASNPQPVVTAAVVLSAKADAARFEQVASKAAPQQPAGAESADRTTVRSTALTDFAGASEADVRSALEAAVQRVSGSPATGDVTTTVPETAAQPVQVAQGTGGVRSDSDAILIFEPVTFDTPITSAFAGINGRTIAQIIETGSPQYAPIEGLPEAVWKQKQCRDCHSWTKADLCQQGRHYLTPAGKPALEKEHPLDGFKRVLRDWASLDCR